MQTFSTARAAKEFLIGRIVSQAQRDGVSFSEIERKIAGIVRSIQQAATPDKCAARNWNKAVSVLRSEDHYLLVLIDSA